MRGANHLLERYLWSKCYIFISRYETQNNLIRERNWYHYFSRLTKQKNYVFAGRGDLYNCVVFFSWDYNMCTYKQLLFGRRSHHTLLDVRWTFLEISVHYMAFNFYFWLIKVIPKIFESCLTFIRYRLTGENCISSFFFFFYKFSFFFNLTEFYHYIYLLYIDI